MSHANAALTPRTRLRLAQLVVDRGWTYAAAAKMFMVAPRTAKKWADRYRAEGAAGMADRSSRPLTSPTRTSRDLVRQIVQLRWRHRLGPVQIAGRLGMAASTVHAVLVRCRINRLTHIDRVTGEPLRRYEHPYPGSLIHVDVTKFANIPDGGGFPFVGRAQGEINRAATATRTGNRSPRGRARIGTAFVHTVIDDHTRMAYAEICADETATTAVGVLHRAVAWFADHGVTTERVLSDNGSAYRSHAWREACAELGITHKRTRPYRPQTNGKIERFHRTLKGDCIRVQTPLSLEDACRQVANYVQRYNTVRLHSAIGYITPKDKLEGRAQEIFDARDRKLAEARERRRVLRQTQPRPTWERRSADRPSIDFAAVKEAISMAEVLGLLRFTPTSTRGAQQRGPCPIHGSRSPRSRSFSANVHDHNFHCFKCGAHGNALDLWASASRQTAYDAALDLCRRLGKDVPTNNPRPEGTTP